MMDRSGFEPEASPMPRERSTPELPALFESHSACIQIKVSIRNCLILSKTPRRHGGAEDILRVSVTPWLIFKDKF